MKELFQYIDDHTQEAIDLMAKFCRQPSVSCQDIGVYEMADLLVEELTQRGFDARRIETPQYPIVYGELKGANPNRVIGCYNHYDVQPPEPLDEWISDPYEGEVRNGRFYARGASDNKGSIAAKLCAIDALKAVRGEVPLTVKFIMEGDEEIGSPQMEDFAKNYPELCKCDAIAWGGGEKITNGGLKMAFGVKGLCYVTLAVRTMSVDAHSSNAAVMPNPAWRLMAALNSMKDVDSDRVLIEGFYDKVKEPTEAQMEYVKKIRNNDEQLRERMGLRDFIGGLRGADLMKKWLFQPTCNICGLTSGYQGPGSKTVMPCTASCKIDFRLVPDQHPDDIMVLLRKHLDDHGFDDIEIIPDSNQPPYCSDTETVFTDILLECGKDVYKPDEQPDVYPLIPGTSSMYPLCHVWGQPAVYFGPGGDDSNVHAPNENVTIENYMNNIKMIASVMDRLSQVEGDMKR